MCVLCVCNLYKFSDPGAETQSTLETLANKGASETQLENYLTESDLELSVSTSEELELHSVLHSSTFPVPAGTSKLPKTTSNWQKIIRIVGIISVVLMVLGIGAVLFKVFVIDQHSNDSSYPPYDQNDTISNRILEQNSVCKVVQMQDDKLTPCSFPL